MPRGMTLAFALPVTWETDMKYCVVWLLGICLSLPAAGADAPSDTVASESAQLPAVPASGAANPQEDPLLKEAAEAAAAPAATGPSEESFTPTVQISEDLSVSFPVDI